MNESKKLKLFISYAHKDESLINQFKSEIENPTIADVSVWYDREIEGGEDWESKIHNNLNDADIICLFISQNFLDSNNCMKEKDAAFDLKDNKNIRVVPIILDECEWKEECKLLSSTQALPADGIPKSEFEGGESSYWYAVTEGLKQAIKTESTIKNIKISKEHSEFLEDIGLLSNAYSGRRKVVLSDIFVYPTVRKIDYLSDSENSENLDKSSEEITKELLKNPRILIVGPDQSGKTTLGKQLFKKIKEMNLIPIFLSDDSKFRSETIKLIERRFNEQYVGVDFADVDKERVVLIVDDFHTAKNKERFLSNISGFKYHILVADDIYSLDFREELEIGVYIYYKIQEFKPSLRDKLIRNWIYLSKKESPEDNSFYESLDKKTEQLDTTLGKFFEKGIMTAHPFNILVVLNNFEAMTPVSSQITSQGYCYEAFIILLLKKNNVKNDEINFYINFLQEFSYNFFTNGKKSISDNEFKKFVLEYSKRFSLLDQKSFVESLEKTKLIHRDNMKNYSFSNGYIYYFFVAKYIANQINKNNEEFKGTIVKEIVENLHKTENAYISIFIAHHTENEHLFNELRNLSKKLFGGFHPSSLDKGELKILDEKADLIIKASLPKEKISPEKNRAKSLAISDEIEKEVEKDSTDDTDFQEFRKSIKTVEVMGSIIKNRAGSLEKEKLKELFTDAMNVHLRIMSCFLDIIKKDSEQDFITSFIRKILDNTNMKKPLLTEAEVENIARRIFWNLNFFIVYGIILKTVVSLGSDKLNEILGLVDQEVNTPATGLIDLGVNLRYMHKLNPEEVSKRMKSKDYSKTAVQIMRYEIIRYARSNKLTYKDIQKIVSILEIPKSKLPFHR